MKTSHISGEAPWRWSAPSLIAALAALGALSACEAASTDTAAGGQFGEESGGCTAAEETPLELDEVAPNGRSAQEIVDRAVGVFPTLLVWADGAETELTFDLSEPSNPRYIEYVYVSADGAEPACDSTVALDLAYSLTSLDGALEESGVWTIEISWSPTIEHGVLLDALNGTFDPTDYADAAYDEVWASLYVEFAADGAYGSIDGLGELSDDGGVSATNFQVATFSPVGDGG